MEENKVSVIIPAYNAESFIQRAINSVLNQTYANFEIIIVENGSTDKTIDLCKKYSQEDGRICVYRSEKGVSHARNKGMQMATGEWIFFLDADDWLEKDSLQILVSAAIKNNVDLVMGEYTTNKNQNLTETRVFQTQKEIEDFTVECLCDPTQKCNVTAVLFRRELLVNSDIKFNPSLSHAEDSVFFVSVMLCNPRSAYVNVGVYSVYYNVQSAVRSKQTNLEQLYLKSILEIQKILKESNQRIKNAFYCFVLNQLLIVLVHGSCSDENKKVTWKMQRDWIMKVSQEEIFSHALTRADLSGLSLSKRVILTLMKKKIFAGVYLGIRLRQRQNAKKANS